MEELSPMQKDHLNSWSVQRDTLLKEIAVLKDEKGKYMKNYESKGISGEDFIGVNLGYKDKLTIDIENLENDIKKLREQKVVLTGDVSDKQKITKDIQDLNIIKNELISQNTKLSDGVIKKEQEQKINVLQNQITALEEKKNTLTKANIELAVSNSDIQDRITKSLGRMEELDKTEKLYMEIVDSKLPELEIKKTKLEIAISELSKDIESLSKKKDSLIKDIMFLITTHEDVYKKTGALEKIVDHVTKVNSENIKQLDTAVTAMTEKVSNILKLSDEQYKAHTEVLTEIPRLFVELRKKSLVREKIK